ADATVLRLARTHPDLVALNRAAYDDPRVRLVTGDAFEWLRSLPPGEASFDVVVSDLPDPGITPSTKLYSQEFYGLVERWLAPGGRLVVHAGTLGSRPHVFWTVDATIRSLGLYSRPYRVEGGGFPGGPYRAPARSGKDEDWSFLLVAREPLPLQLPPARPPLLSLDREGLAAAGRSAERSRVAGLRPSTLMHPRYVQ
ncbi:spermidine synthase, partial [Streptomyces sp. AA8]|uniref:spermine/spermidine synthase domain-containing protein n=1 Tax=Streptomyces telluris TaxID=2720021 RepID=UPI0016A8EF38|nr:spermidine synthase [Streptomyces telluris]